MRQTDGQTEKETGSQIEKDREENMKDKRSKQTSKQKSKNRETNTTKCRYKMSIQNVSLFMNTKLLTTERSTTTFKNAFT